MLYCIFPNNSYIAPPPADTSDDSSDGSSDGSDSSEGSDSSDGSDTTDPAPTGSVNMYVNVLLLIILFSIISGFSLQKTFWFYQGGGLKFFLHVMTLREEHILL